MTKTNRIRFTLVLLALCFSGQWFFAQALSEETVSGKLFTAEGFGGFLLFNPRDLNLRAVYDSRFLDNQRDFSNLYAPTPLADTAVGDFQPIRSSLPFGFRMKVRMSERWALSLGFKYMSKDQVSNVSARYPDYGARPLEVSYSFSPYSISASAFSPLLGLHFHLWKSSLFDLGLFVTGGPLFADCRYSVGTLRVDFRHGQATNAHETLYEINGRSMGITLESGACLHVAVYRNIRVLFEGGYTYQRARNLKGEGRLEYYRYTGVASRLLSDRLEWEGYWGIKEAPPLAPLPSNGWEKEDARVRDFFLDLSGAFLRVGISYSFSL